MTPTQNQRPILLPQPRRFRQARDILCPSGNPVRTARDASIPTQGYRLEIQPAEIRITSNDAAGEFYARQTLLQLQRQHPRAMLMTTIEDHPDFPVRGVMLDISRDKVPTMATLFQLVDLLSSWKINQLQLYTEHTFAYSQHRVVWEHASPMTAEEIRALDAYCKERFIDLVPNQNSLGHMERWLRHEHYIHLAEAPDGADTPWGFRWKGPFSLCPTNPACLQFLGGLYTELLPNFSSTFFNVGLDEAFDIGQGRSHGEAQHIGKQRVYLNFLRQVHAMLQRRGTQMMFWGDIILHSPELIAELPKDAIALNWGYEADHPFEKESAAFAAAGVPFYVCPGTSSWNSIAGRTDNAIANCRAAAEAGRRHGAIGYLNTDWGDNGHLQYLPMSYLGFAAGAAFSWCAESNQNLDFVAALNLHAFDDVASPLGRALFDLGNVYQACGKLNRNGSTLFRVMVPPPNDPRPEQGLTAEGLNAAERAITAAIANLAPSPRTRGEGRGEGDFEHNVAVVLQNHPHPNPLGGSRPIPSLLPEYGERGPNQQTLIAEELRNAAAILHRCIAVARQKLNFAGPPGPDVVAIIANHRRLWLARNRPGGLEDSVRRLNPAQSDAGWI